MRYLVEVRERSATIASSEDEKRGKDMPQNKPANRSGPGDRGNRCGNEIERIEEINGFDALLIRAS
jgi:hypothetical protein